MLGFRAMAPLWLGVIPFGLAYAVIARDAGLSLLETQALSLLVFAGSAQVSAAGLFGIGAGGLEIVLTTLLLNVRHVLYGLALARRTPLSRRQRPVAAYFLTDEAFGVVAVSTDRRFTFLLGAELSLFATSSSRSPSSRFSCPSCAPGSSSAWRPPPARSPTCSLAS
jgi:predicted branched-subunit amino acid permease